MDLGLVFTFFVALLGGVFGASDIVTCGSVLKLVNTHFQARLHSHDVKYGSGSGQQSVTGTDVQEDVNSHWAIKGSTKKFCNRGEPIECGQEIRLEHLTTKRNLHSHLFSSPLSRNQEVSAFGEDGEGDTGDNWIVVCEGEHWRRGDKIMFRHVDTETYLGVTDNTYGRPIHGQREVATFNSPNHSTRWETSEGLFILKSDFDPIKAAHVDNAHTEL
jgi:dolichyl-phosphate-mannose--protein O-mannosyl transferase